HRISTLSLHDALPIYVEAQVLELEVRWTDDTLGIVRAFRDPRAGRGGMLAAKRLQQWDPVEAAATLPELALETILAPGVDRLGEDRKSTRLNSSHDQI